MKANVILSVMILCLAQSTANAHLPSVTELVDWFQAPHEAPPWAFLSENNEYRLLASSALYGGNHLWYKKQGQHCVVSVPHQFYDKFTLEIGEPIYQSLCQVLVTNSHQRYSDSEDSEPMDLSKRKTSLHHNAIVAFQSRFVDTKIFQIHGFSQNKRKTPIGQQADFIVSQGKHIDSSLQQLTACLQTLSPHSYSYPLQVTELGGIKNVLHQYVMAKSFYHIEISKPMREKLINNNLMMEQLTTCLRSAL